jgi:hypothetical protein
LAFFDFGASARTLPNGRMATSSEQRMRFITCFLAFLGELESRYLVPMLPSLELVLIAVAIPTISRPSPTAVEDEITSRVDCVDQAAPEAGRCWQSSHRDPQMGGEIATRPCLCAMAGDQTVSWWRNLSPTTLRDYRLIDVHHARSLPQCVGAASQTWDNPGWTPG